MLICDKCGAQILQGAKFCPQCADPVTEADLIAQPQQILASVEDEEILVCPKCTHQFRYGVSVAGSSYSLICPRCNTAFISRVFKVRAKRARGYRRENTRHFSVRVLDASGNDELIEFVNANYEDFELRAKDVAVFTYLGDELKIVQNLTVGQYMKVSKPKCYVATYLYGETSETVAMLRLFRDDVLLGSPIFSPLVSVYYRISPVVIRWFGDRKIFRAICLIFMIPITNRVRNWQLKRMEELEATE